MRLSEGNVSIPEFNNILMPESIGWHTDTGILDNTILENLKLEKIEKTATKLLNAIKGNSDFIN